jgi:hypothetical protein
VIDPARPGANPPHAPRGHPGDKRRDECSQQAARPQAGRGATTTAYTRTLNRRGPFSPQATITGSRAPASRTPPAPPPAAGLRPVLDPASPLARTRHLRGERQRHGASSACPANTPQPRNRRPKPRLTPAHSFRDEWTRHYVTVSPPALLGARKRLIACPWADREGLFGSQSALRVPLIPLAYLPAAWHTVNR